MLACSALIRKRRARNRHRLRLARMILRAMELALEWHRIRTRHYLRRKDLVAMHASPWAHIKQIREDHSALQVMGLTWASFDHLHGFFAPILQGLWRSRHSGNNPRGSGRKRLMETQDVLGLTLTWLHVPAYHVMLMLTWSLAPGTLSVYLRDWQQCLLCAFKRCAEARVTWPDVPTMHGLAELITARQPQLHGVFGFVDGLNLAIHDPPVGAMQNAYYNGWLGGCYCSSLLLFGPDGCILWCTLNWPGSWSDAALARQLYDLLTDLPDGLAIAADSAFTRADMAARIIRPLKADEMERYSRTVSVRQFVAAVKRHRLALSIRQSAEWGMGAFQQMVGRLHHRLSADPKTRRQLLDLACHYYNYRTRTVGLNQIRTVYDPEHTSMVIYDRPTYYHSLRTQAVY